MASEAPALKRGTILAFAALVLLVGSNVVAIRFAARELDPFWGAGARFALAGLVFAAATVALKVPLPTGKSLAGAVVYGLIGITAYFALVYWGLEEVRAGFAAVILSLTPLLTLLFVSAHRLETVGWRSALGALLSLGGVATIFGDQLSHDLPAVAALTIVLAAACGAESSIIAKSLTGIHPVAMNTVAMAVAAPILLVLSLAIGEEQIVPKQRDTVLAFAYVVSAGTLGIFMLVLYVLQRWKASATSYQFVLAPLVSLPLAALLLSESLSALFLIGSALVLAGVYLGAFLTITGPAPASTRTGVTD